MHGNLFIQADRTLDLLLTKYMKAYIHYEGIQRVERFLFPREALREVLLNALVHRDYSSGVPIQIRVYDDRIRFSNDAQLPEGLTADRLLSAHRSQPHNPLLAGALFRSGDIESWGRGIDKIRDACRTHGAEFPVLSVEPFSFTVEFRGVVPEDDQDAGALTAAQVTAQVDGTSKFLQEGELGWIQPASEQVTAQVIAQVVHFCSEPRGAREIMALLGMRHWKTFQMNYLSTLLDSGLLEMTVPDKPRSSKQKYRLTDEGRRLLQQLGSDD